MTAPTEQRQGNDQHTTHATHITIITYIFTHTNHIGSDRTGTI
jgi:hypothetical protein